MQDFHDSSCLDDGDGVFHSQPHVHGGLVLHEVGGHQEEDIPFILGGERVRKKRKRKKRKEKKRKKKKRKKEKKKKRKKEKKKKRKRKKRKKNYPHTHAEIALYAMRYNVETPMLGLLFFYLVKKKKKKKI